jgi:antitoxin component HigA of HigAB toxin-antitoxin module
MQNEVEYEDAVKLVGKNMQHHVTTDTAHRCSCPCHFAAAAQNEVEYEDAVKLCAKGVQQPSHVGRQTEHTCHMLPLLCFMQNEEEYEDAVQLVGKGVQQHVTNDTTHRSSCLCHSTVAAAAAVVQKEVEYEDAVKLVGKGVRLVLLHRKCGP